MSIGNVTGVRSDIADILDKIRDISNKSTVFNHDTTKTETNAFSKALDMAKTSVDNVSELMSKTENLRNSYVSGDPSVSLGQVVISSQKSKLAFEGLVVVRNKCLEAYKEIMNMPV